MNLAAFLDHYIIAIIMTSITIYSLFFDDIRALAFNEPQDKYFYGCSAFCMGAFIVEIFLAAISKEDYFPGFFFWLDVVATISMIPDIGWLWTLITGGSSGVANAS